MQDGQQAIDKILEWSNDWPLFADEVLGVSLDDEQKAILSSVQVNPMTSVASGTARGKDFISAVAALCFMYLTPEWNADGEMVKNTKVAMTAPTDRQVGNIMFPEVAKLYNRAKKRGVHLPGRLTGYDIRTDNEEWFLTGFKADQHNHEAWSGFHAANTMFIITEASGIPENVFHAIEGNLQGNSRILIVFNPNTPHGYAARSQKSARWAKFRLNSLNAPNVQQRKDVIPGQVDFKWVWDKVTEWCQEIAEDDYKEGEGDFSFIDPAGELRWYRPNDLFRVKVLGMFPRVSEGALIPLEWIQLANERWKKLKASNQAVKVPLRLGNDVAGMGRDSSCYCYRYGNLIDRFEISHAAGKAEHMAVAGKVCSILTTQTDKFNGVYPQAFIDTIGEGAGVYSRLQELADEGKLTGKHIHSVKYSESASDGSAPRTDITGQYQFLNMRSYLFWAVRDWLNPDNKMEPALCPDDQLAEEATEIQWKFNSRGVIQIEPKEDIKKRLKRSTDKFDALANTFYPVPDVPVGSEPQTKNIGGYFF